MVFSANGKSGRLNITGIPTPRCYYCRRELDFEFDYSCINCGCITCDNHQEVCSEDDDNYVEKGCGLVTCFVCFDEHTISHHPASEDL